MTGVVQAEPLWRIASARMPTRWGMFDAVGFERDVSNGTPRVETALAIVMGDLTEGVPLLRIHSQCFTGEALGSLRCDCRDQLEMAMQAIADEGRGLVIYEYQEGRGIGLMGCRTPASIRSRPIMPWASRRIAGTSACRPRSCAISASNGSVCSRTTRVRPAHWPRTASKWSPSSPAKRRQIRIRSPICRPKRKEWVTP
jgi:GTP cyclohydrolase II